MGNPDFMKAIAGGVSDALSDVKKLPMMLTALRNGGAESLLRALVNHKLEEATGCVAFTEAAKRRADLALIRPEDNAAVAFVEFKHNFVSQRLDIAYEMKKAKLQLISQRLGNETEGAAAVGSSAVEGSMPTRQEAVYVYVHFLVSLDHGSAGSPSGLAAIHNRNVTGYKRFFDAQSAAEQRAEAINIARAELPHWEPSDDEMRKFFVSHEIGPAGARCTLICWAFALEDDSFIPLQLMA